MNNTRLLLYLLTGSAICTSVTFAADAFDQIAPKPVPPVGNTAAPLASSSMAGDVNDTEVLLNRLDGVVLVSSPKSVVTNGRRDSGLVIEGFTPPKPRQLTKVVDGYLGKKLTKGDLNKLVRDIVLHYRQADLPIVDVIVPNQDIATGTVQLVVLEARLGQVTTTGNIWTKSDEIKAQVPLKEGDEVRASELQADLDWLNSDPFHTTTAVYHPGQRMGTTDIELQTEDRFPARFYGGYEDSGNSSTGFDRYLAGFNWGDAFYLGQDQQLNYQYTTSGDGQGIRAHSGSYVVPLPWRNTLTFFGSYTDTKGTVPPLVSLNGRSYQISGRYSIPLPNLTYAPFNLSYRHSFGFGFDYKYNKNSLLFGGDVAPISLYDVDQFGLAYNGALTDDYGQTTLNDQLYISPGNWGGNNNDAAFAAAHGGGNSDYVYNTIVLERLTKLPKDFSLVLRGTVQTSNSNLPPSEQLGFGGYDTIRGYDEREVNSDDGFIFTTEVRTPPLSVGQIFKIQKLQDQLQFLGFWDYGSANNHAPLAGEAPDTLLSSVGFGVRYSVNTYLTVRYDLGFQLLKTGLDNDHGNRSSLGIVLSY